MSSRPSTVHGTCILLDCVHSAGVSAEDLASLHCYAFPSVIPLPIIEAFPPKASTRIFVCYWVRACVRITVHRLKFVSRRDTRGCECSQENTQRKMLCAYAARKAHRENTRIICVLLQQTLWISHLRLNIGSPRLPEAIRDMIQIVFGPLFFRQFSFATTALISLP